MVLRRWHRVIDPFYLFFIMERVYDATRIRPNLRESSLFTMYCYTFVCYVSLCLLYYVLFFMYCYTYYTMYCTFVRCIFLYFGKNEGRVP